MKDKIEEIIEKTGATREYRKMLPDGEILIADGWSAPPHSDYARFLKRSGMVEDMSKEFPLGAYVTMWWIFGDEPATPMGVLLFEPFHDFGVSIEEKKARRVRAAMDKVSDAMNEVRKMKREIEHAGLH